jgi:MSHA pilin protein MshC
MSARFPRNPHRRAGFTLVEFVVAIAVLVSFLAVAVPRFYTDRTFMQRGYYEELASALKYAQKLAVASGCAVRFEVTASGYQARQQAAHNDICSVADTFADGRVLGGRTPLGVAASPSVTLLFDARGRTNLDSDQRISVGPFALTVRAESGFVQAP